MTNQIKACPWQLNRDSRKYPEKSQCLQWDCMAWDEDEGCLLIPKKQSKTLFPHWAKIGIGREVT